MKFFTVMQINSDITSKNYSRQANVVQDTSG